MAGDIKRRWTAAEFFDGAGPPTDDDVPVAADGRILDTPKKLIAYLDEVNVQRAGTPVKWLTKIRSGDPGPDLDRGGHRQPRNCG